MDNPSDPADQREPGRQGSPPTSGHKALAEHTAGSIRQLVCVLRSLYRLVHAAVEAAAVLILFFGFILIHFGAPLEVIAALVVLTVAVGVYVARKNFGEAALALIAGMLPVLTTDWNVRRFSLFVATWAALGLGGLLVRSIAMASKSEKIFFHAGAATQGYLGDDAAQALERVSNETPYVGLGPIEKAVVLREFAFRKLPLARMPGALEMCGQLSALWEVDHLEMAVFVADLHRMLPDVDENGIPLKDQIYVLVRDSSVSPSEFLAAFKTSKRLALSSRINPVVYLRLLVGSLHDGVPAEDIYEYIKEAVDQFLKEVLQGEPGLQS